MRILLFLKNNPNIRDSLILHIVILLIFTFGIGFSIGKSVTSAPPIIVDLSEIKIAEKTNLPVKTEKKKEVAAKKQHAKPKPAKKTPPKPAPVKPKTAPSKKSETALVAKKKTEAKPKTKPEPKPKPEPEKKSNSLSSLLASVEKMEKDIPAAPQSDLDKLTEGIVAKGITNQPKGNPNLALTIGQKDAIASKLRQCWNIDAGGKGVFDMTVGIKTYLDRDGKVSKAVIEDTKKYSDDKVFRAIADSARRAVYVCDKKGDESPFKILSKFYPNEYNMWKELYLQFNPLDGGVF